MITIKSASEIEHMKLAGLITEKALLAVKNAARVGMTTSRLDAIARKCIEDNGATPSFLNYDGFPASICISINEQVVHGIPGDYVLKDGDLVSIDVGAKINGFHGDAARSFIVGEGGSPEAYALIKNTRECFFEGVKNAIAGNHICDIAKAIQAHAESAGYGVVRALIGHGVGRNLHEGPEVPNYYIPTHGKGTKLLPGMTIAIEPMITLGTYRVFVLDNDWTVVTADGSKSAHYENTIAITEGEPIILTMQLEDCNEQLRQ